MNAIAEIRAVLRRLRRRAGFLFVALLSLAFGVALNLLVFNAVNSLLLKPIPVPDANRVMSLSFRRGPTTSYPNYTDLRDRNSAFTELAAVRYVPLHLRYGEHQDRVWGYLASGNYFDALRLKAARGRLLKPEDDSPGEAPLAAVISYSCWQTRFGANADIVGRRVRLNDAPFTIVGVAPAGFAGTESLLQSQFWVPMGAVRTVEGQDWRAARNASNVWLIGRLRPGLTQRQAEVSLSVQAAELAREYPTTDDDLQIRLSAPGLFGNRLRGAAWGLGTVLLAVAGLTLLTACTNMAAIEMAQISDRRRELATRVALGARSAALVRIVLLESLVTAVLAGCVAVAVAWWLWSGVTSALPAFEFPIQSELAFDWRLILFGVVVVAASALLVGLIPALRAGRADPIFTMKNEPARLHRGRIELRRLYVSLQVAVSVVLTGAAFLMIATLKDALTMDVGFDPHHVFVLRYDLDMYRYTPERGQRFQKLLLDRAGAMPGVVSASLSSSIPFSIDQSTTAVTVEGTPAVSAGKLPSALLYSAEPAFFRTMGIRLTRGRDFDSNDRADTPRVAIVNRTLAASLLRGRDPIGQRLKLGVNGELVSVVGVAEAGKYRSIHEDAQFAIWLPMAQRYNGTNALVVRWAPQRPLTLESLESLINGLAPELLVFDARPIDRFLDLALTPLRLTLEALLAMAGLAVFLSAAGLYAMLKHDATRRTREIGIRLALGATKRDILLLVSRRTCVTVAASTIAGAAVASFLLRYLGAQFGTSLSLSVIALAAVSVLIVGIVAALLPAVRATGILPSSALRHEI